MRKRVLSLYPEAWRERYGEEMAALLEETPPGLRATLDLLRGAIRAHRRPMVGTEPAARARGTIAFVLGCFILFCVLGAGFAKTTENYNRTEHFRALLGVSHDVITVGAMAALFALGLAALPLAWAALAEARRTRNPVLMRLIAIPPTAILLFAGSIGLLVLWLDAHHQAAGAGGWLLLALCGVCGAAAGFACWAAPRAIMRRLAIPRRALRISVPAIGLVALCMAVVCVAMGAFLIGIAADAPQLGASGNGPGQLIDVTTSIAIQLAGMLVLSVVAAVSASRGVRALRGL